MGLCQRLRRGAPAAKPRPQAMQFLHEQPSFSLVEGTKTDTFVADLFQPRPGFDELAAFHQWGTDARKKMLEAMDRKSCPVAWMALVIDEHGALVVLRFRQEIQPSNAKSATRYVLDCLPQQQRDAVEKDLRPLDELDMLRIKAWKTLAALRPKEKRKRDASSDEEDAEPLAKRPRPMHELLAELSSDSESEQEATPPRLALSHAPHSAPSARGGAASASATPDVSVLALLDPTCAWQPLAELMAAIVVAEAGQRPAELPFIRCHREKRRELLLKSAVEAEWSNPSLVKFVQAAMKLAKEGSLPSFKQGARAEFLCRCAAALLRSNPRAEGNVCKLSAEDQALIRHAVGGGEVPYDGCLNEECAGKGKKPKWDTKPFILEPGGEAEGTTSRCAYCGFLRANGRTYTSVNGLQKLKPTPTHRILGR